MDGNKMFNLPQGVNLQGYSLILPSIGVGNVGQLSVDILISTLGLRKVGTLHSTMFVPIAGMDPYDSNSSTLCSAADFYIDDRYKLIILQLRSLLVEDPTEFFKGIGMLAQTEKLQKIIVLSSAYDYERTERQDNSLRFLANRQECPDNLGFTRHNGRIPGGGFASGLYEYLTETDIPCIVLFRYCAEGDNISDSEQLTDGLNQWLTLFDKDKIKYPPSWIYLFGNPPPIDMY